MPIDNPQATTDPERMPGDLSLLFGVESLQAAHLSGIGRYTRGLIAALLEDGRVGSLLGFDSTGARPIAVSDAKGDSPAAPPSRATPLRRLKRAVVDLLPGGDRIHQWVYDRRLRRVLAPHGERIYHEPNFMLRPFAGPTVTTIHDLSVLRYPEFHPKERVTQFERLLPRTLARADRIVTDAPLIRAEIIDTLGVAAERIVAVPIGIDAVYRPVSADRRSAVLRRYGLDDRGYLFCVGTLEPRKNLAGLVDAYGKLPTALRRQFPLVMAGGRGWREELFENKVANLEQSGEVRRLGYVPEGDLPALYSGARAFAFPSFYEGFGLPPLEALACATPVLTSRGTAMEELAGQDSLLVDPHDVDAISRGLEEVLTDERALERAAKTAPVLAGRYSWRACAAAMIAIYRAL